MKWTIHYYDETVQDKILSLPKTLLAKYIQTTDLMIEQGSNLGGNLTKQLDKGLYELRLKGKEGIARVLYCTVINRKIVMLHSFVKKTQKTPKKELNIAKKRLKEAKYQQGEYDD